MNKKNFIFLTLLFCLFAISTANGENNQLSHHEKEKKISPSPFAGMAAKTTDKFIIKGNQSVFLKPISFVGARASSLVLLPIGISADLVYNTTMGNPLGIQNSSLALITAPVGVISPDLVSHHFIPEQKTNSIISCGKLYKTSAFEYTPSSEEEIRQIIDFAKSTNKHISVKGAGMSQGKQTLPDQTGHIIINTAMMNQISINPTTKIAKVGPGVTWKDLQKEANSYGLAVQVMQASNIFSVGGSLSVNCHGWDHKNGTLRNTVLSITTMDPDGNVHVLTPQEDFFDYVIGGYGGFGIIVEAELLLTDNHLLYEIGEVVDPRDYANYFRQNVRKHPEIEMHLYRLSLEPQNLFKSGVAVHYIKYDEIPYVANLIDEPEKGTTLDRIKLHIVRRLNWARKLAWKVEKSDMLKPKVATRNEFMRPPINPIFNNSGYDSEWLQEYFVPEEDLVDFLSFLGNVLQENQVPLFNASVRFVKQDSNSKLSFAQDGDRFAIVLFFNQNLSKNEVRKTKRWTRKVIDRVLEGGGSYYLPYQHFATIDQFQKSYPQWQSVVEMKKSYDPQMLFFNGLYSEYLLPSVVEEVDEESYFRQIFQNEEGREKVNGFLQNVFMQLEEDKFFALMDSILENQELNDEEIYHKLCKKIDSSKANFVWQTKNKLKSLGALKRELAQQVSFLLSPQTEINGYVEIGYTGRLVRPLKKYFRINSPIYVINEQEHLTDYIEVSGTRPYDRFIHLNDYEPIPENEIPSSSVDVVACYIGFHHAPPEKLEAFIDSIYRMIRPGGTLILMDHDAYDEEMSVFVDVVHSIFNAATGVSESQNQEEVRNFHPLRDWITFLEGKGFQYNVEKGVYIREGDSTLNSLIRFDKPMTLVESISDSFKDNDQYVRPLLRTYMTGPEWQNVRSAQAYAAFVKTQPGYQYPYFQDIKAFWQVYDKSWKATRKDHSFTETAFSENNAMNLFIGTMMTLEYSAKGILSLPPAFLFGKESTPRKLTRPELEHIRSLENYGNFIQNTPFYQYPYFGDVKKYWITYSQSIKDDRKQKGTLRTIFSTKNAKNLLKGTATTFEYGVKGIFSTPFALVYGSEVFKESETIHLLVSDPENIIELVDTRIQLVDSYPDLFIKHIEMPRYLEFRDVIEEMSKYNSITLLNVAGQKKIQIDVKYPKDVDVAFLKCKKLYDIPMPTDRENNYVAYEVNITDLLEAVRDFNSKDVNILYIHDY